MFFFSRLMLCSPFTKYLVDDMSKLVTGCIFVFVTEATGQIIRFLIVHSNKGKLGPRKYEKLVMLWDCRTSFEIYKARG